MPASSGQTTSTIYDAGQPIVCVTWFFNPATLVLRNNPADWTDPSGTVWTAGSGALIGVNLTSVAVRVVVYDTDGVTVLRRVKLPANGGHAVTKTVLANLAPPDGPFTLSTDFNGLTFDLSGAQ